MRQSKFRLLLLLLIYRIRVSRLKLSLDLRARSLYARLDGDVIVTVSGLRFRGRVPIDGLGPSVLQVREHGFELLLVRRLDRPMLDEGIGLRVHLEHLVLDPFVAPVGHWLVLLVLVLLVVVVVVPRTRVRLRVFKFVLAFQQLVRIVREIVVREVARGAGLLVARLGGERRGARIRATIDPLWHRVVIEGRQFRAGRAVRTIALVVTRHRVVQLALRRQTERLQGIVTAAVAGEEDLLVLRSRFP